MKQLQIISPLSYCHIPRPFDKNDLIIRAVKVEDILNHPFTPMTIPKMRYPKAKTLGYGFFKQLLP